jgi:hypothetical protein
VVDKQGLQVCAPPDGDPAAGCTPGDVGAFTFGVEPLTIRPSSFSDGATNVSTNPTLSFRINAPVDTATLAGIQIAPAPPGTPMITTPLGTSIRITFSMPLAPQTQYSVTFPTTITDAYGQPLPEAQTYRFTTGN